MLAIPFKSGSFCSLKIINILIILMIRYRRINKLFLLIIIFVNNFLWFPLISLVLLVNLFA